MQADEDQQREPLLNEITTRKKFDLGSGRAYFWMAQVQGGITVAASFGSAIAAAAKAPSIIVAVIAAVPGAVILLDRNFGFARRARYHWLQANKLLELEHALKYQKAEVAEISKRFAQLRSEMIQKFPIVEDELSQKVTAKEKPKPRSGGQQENR